MVLLLSEGAAADAAARDRLAGEVNEMHIDTVLARGGQGQDTGRLGRRFVAPDTPVAPDARPDAPWVALACDGSPGRCRGGSAGARRRRAGHAAAVGRPSGPDYQPPWIDKVRPGLARLWPLPWPGRYDRAGWRLILVSWLLMLLIAALAVLIAILIFHEPAPAEPAAARPGHRQPAARVVLASVRLAVAAVRLPVRVGIPVAVRPSGSPSPSNSGSQSGSPSPGGREPPADADSGSPGEPTPPSRL